MGLLGELIDSPFDTTQDDEPGEEQRIRRHQHAPVAEITRRSRHQRGGEQKATMKAPWFVVLRTPALVRFPRSKAAGGSHPSFRQMCTSALRPKPERESSRLSSDEIITCLSYLNPNNEISDGIVWRCKPSVTCRCWGGNSRNWRERRLAPNRSGNSSRLFIHSYG